MIKNHDSMFFAPLVAREQASVTLSMRMTVILPVMLALTLYTKTKLSLNLDIKRINNKCQ